MQRGPDPRKNLWLELVVVAPDAAASLPLPPQQQWVRLDQPGQEAYLWFVQQGFNYYHAVGEELPSLANTLCRHLGRCTYANRTGLHVFAGGADKKPHPKLVDTLRCITDVPLVGACKRLRPEHRRSTGSADDQAAESVLT